MQSPFNYLSVLLDFHKFRKCVLCNAPLPEPAHFHRVHKIAIKKYYETHFPKFDVVSNERIPFKSIEQYFCAGFVNKNNLKRYFKEIIPTDCAKIEWMIKFLLSRQVVLEKTTMYLPSQFELKSLCCPTWLTFAKINGAMRTIVLHTKGIERYNYIAAEKHIASPWAEPAEFFVDTREQKVLNFAPTTSIKIQKLNYGDYTWKNNNNNLFIERKSLPDLIGTISQGYDRFVNEIERAQRDQAHIIVCVEDTYENLQMFNKLPQCRRIKATPEFIFHRIRELLQTFPNLQFVCLDGRYQMSSFLELLFELDLRKKNLQTLDFQYSMDAGLLQF